MNPHPAAAAGARGPRRVLLLAFYFPPLGGAGVQRAVKFAKHLPAHGFEPVVVTGAAQARTRHAPLDASLGAQGPPPDRVFRAAQPLPPDHHTARARWLARPTPFARAWTLACEETGLRAAAALPVDVILATMSPFETSLAAERLSQRLGVPWVADLRDPWALDEMSAYPSGIHRRLELARMRRRLQGASRVIMNTPEAAAAVREAFPELAARTLSITNGYDAEDFAGPPPARSDDRFRIVHAGSLHVALGRAHARRRLLRRLFGGERVPVDILTRSHLYLLRALEAWQRVAPDEVARVELVLAGDASDADREVVGLSAVADRVRFTGYVSHAESVGWLRSADVLFLPMHALPPGERARIVPGKTYEYLAAKRPILAAVPEGDAHDFVLASGLGDVCEPHDVDAMCAALRRRFADARAGRVRAPAPEPFYARFERRVLAADLAGALDALLAARPA